MESAAVHVPFAEAETTRRRLIQEGRLRTDLKVERDQAGIWFPTTDGDQRHEFTPQDVRPRHYTDLLDWPEADKQACPRAFDVLGDILLVKVPNHLWPRRSELGEAMRRFHAARAVFHDHGVIGAFRTRNLERIAGDGGSETQVAENGVRLHVDPAAAYYSPRLADERGRIAALIQPSARVIDLFGGVAPQGVQIARSVPDVDMVSIDLNPDAIRLAKRNVTHNKVQVALHCGDARDLAKRLDPADHVIMNLPHGAKQFLAEGAHLTRPGGTLHHHEILRTQDLASRQKDLVTAFDDLGRRAAIRHTRHVRAYSAKEAHFVFDVRLA